MEVQSMSVCVPGRCVNNCAYCVSQMHESPYKDRVTGILHGWTSMKDRRTEQEYAKRLDFARDNGTNFIVLTGTCEPMQHKAFLQMFANLNGRLRSPFKAIDLQTTGVFLTDENLDWLQDEIGVTTIALSVADIFDLANNFALQKTPPKLQFDLAALCKNIRERGLTLRVSLNLTDVYTARTPEEILEAARALGGEQLVLRQMFAETGGTSEKDDWIRAHALPATPTVRPAEAGELATDSFLLLQATASPQEFAERRSPGLTVFDLNRYIHEKGKALDTLSYGATRYSVHGMSTVLDDDCMAQKNGVKASLRYLVLQPDCRLYTRWDDPASLLF